MTRQETSRLWRRGDRPGHEAARLLALERGFRLEGTAVFGEQPSATCLRYVVELDAQWRTRSTRVSGWVGPESIEVEIERAPDGLWTMNGSEVEAVAGCVDVDLNFSPSTNLLPIRRLALEVGATGTVAAAWLRYPGFRLERLEQSYTRLGERVYRYESAGGRFTRDLEVDAHGLVIDYPEFWYAEGP